MAVGYSNTQSEIPDWLKPYVTGYDASGTLVDPNKGVLGRAGALLNQAPATYDATKAEAIGSVQNRIAGFNPMQEQAFKDIGTMAPSEYIGQGAGLMGMAGTSTYNAPMAQRYMDPYMQMVVDQQKKSAVADYQRQMPSLTSAAYSAGAGRGTRSALMQSEANRNLQNNLQNMQAQGLQNAWQQGQGQFNTEAARQLQAGQGLLGAAGTDYSQRMGINAARQAAGGTMQGQEQNLLSTAYEDYLAQQREPYQKLGWYSDVLQGIPASASASQMYTPSGKVNTAGQNLGLITAGLGSILG
jgi:hypothetical protein